MDFLKQMSIIFAVCLVSNFISNILPFAFPGSIISMILLFVLLLTRVVRLRKVLDAGDFLLGNMAFLFVPTVVGLMEYLPVLWENIIAFIVIIIVTTVLTFAATAYTVTAVIRLQRKWKGGDK